MATSVQQIDLTSLGVWFQSLTQTLGANGKGLLNTGFVAAKYNHIASAGTFALQGSAGTLLSLNFNTAAAGTATLYDSSSVAVLPGSLVVASLSLASGAPSLISFGPPNRGLALNTGLVVVTTGTADITIGHT